MNRGLFKKEHGIISRPAYNLLAAYQTKTLYIYNEAETVFLDELKDAGYIVVFEDLFGKFFFLI